MPDFTGMLSSERFYGSQIGKDVRVAFKFEGKPASNGKHKLSGIKEDTIADGVDIPTQQDQNRAGSTGDRFMQSVSFYGAHLQATQDWMNLGGQGYSEKNAGKLTISVYSLLEGKEFVQIGNFECAKACPVQYGADGSVYFLCTDSIQWSAKCNTNTSDDTKQDWAAAWNNSTVG